MPRQQEFEESVPISRKSTSRKNKKRGHNNKRIKIDLDNGQVSEYYLAVSDRYKHARTLSFLLLIIFLAVNLMFFRSSITYDNMMYLLRDLDTGATAHTSEFSSVSYIEEDAVSFQLFKGRLAAAGSTGFRLYNATGSRDLEKEAFMQNPSLVCGEKYSLTYDAGASSYNVYTTIACVLSQTTDTIIEDAAMSDSGFYALLTRSNEAKYLVTVYSSNFRPVTKYYKDKYVVDIALDKNGEKLAIVSADVVSSGINCEIMVCRTGTDNTVSITSENAMPLGVKYMPNGNILVICDSKIIVSDGTKIIKEYAFDSVSPAFFAFSEDALAIVCTENAVGSNNTVFLFDSEGNLIYNNKITDKVERVSLDGKRMIYVLCDDKIVRFDTAGDVSESQISEKIIDIVPVYGELLSCTATGASIVPFNK